MMVVECRIRISSEDYYSCDLTKKIPVRVSIVTIDGDTGFGITEPLEHGEQALQAYVDGLRESPSVLEVDVTYRSSQAYWTRVVHRLNRDSIYETVLRNGCMTRLPIVIQRGVQHHNILAPSRNLLGQLLQDLRKRFTKVEIARVRERPTDPYRAILTEKQQEALVLAYKSGYYDMPRKVKLADLGEKLGIRRVAMQERLRRAELRVLTEFTEEMLA
ncbi:MAG: helix-turn-helix domain-containing protein [Candidatus Hermodarchaeota archaeon]